jgi:hypothetical protein
MAQRICTVLVQKTGNSPGEEKMSKFKFITLAASIMLALAFTISCSDDKEEGGGYLSCEEMGNLLKDGFMGGNPDTYIDDLKGKCKTEARTEIQAQCSGKSGKELDTCAGNIVMKCMENDPDVKKLCGGNSFMECGKHYDDTCKE